MRTHDVALWNGTDTSLATPTTLQYFGAIGQIEAGGNTTTIGTSRQHRGRLEVYGGADGGEFVVRSSSDGDLCQSGPARLDRPRDEDRIQRGSFDRGNHRRVYA